jgi:hypothetical protein
MRHGLIHWCLIPWVPALLLMTNCTGWRDSTACQSRISAPVPTLLCNGVTSQANTRVAPGEMGSLSGLRTLLVVREARMLGRLAQVSN